MIPDKRFKPKEGAADNPAASRPKEASMMPRSGIASLKLGLDMWTRLAVTSPAVTLSQTIPASRSSARPSLPAWNIWNMIPDKATNVCFSTGLTQAEETSSICARKSLCIKSNNNVQSQRLASQSRVFQKLVTRPHAPASFANMFGGRETS